MLRNSLLMVALLGIISCHHAPVAPPNPALAAEAAAKQNFKGLVFALQKDPACGMPLKAGVGDTVTYKGKLYGFCSKECKDAFLENPDSSLAANK